MAQIGRDVTVVGGLPVGKQETREAAAEPGRSATPTASTRSGVRVSCSRNSRTARNGGRAEAGSAGSISPRPAMRVALRVVTSLS
ncbi:hypothetical protein Rhow_003370 [Rhodococcus wratislaviensis]|uniref:Uncharacterized protein n=1 Tax=Rhodococcus wratislaviensis TaxID=44752 RepID=A0A402C883_RHOWR|nr:hypothetical protein Rhow_003370 [Rhodococcus wratislaviensis]